MPAKPPSGSTPRFRGRDANRRRHALVERPAKRGPASEGRSRGHPRENSNLPRRREPSLRYVLEGPAAARALAASQDEPSGLGEARQHVERLGWHRSTCGTTQRDSGRRRSHRCLRCAHGAPAPRRRRRRSRSRHRGWTRRLRAQPLAHEIEQMHLAQRRVRVRVVHRKVERDVVAGPALPKHGTHPLQVARHVRHRNPPRVAVVEDTGGVEAPARIRFALRVEGQPWPMSCVIPCRKWRSASAFTSSGVARNAGECSQVQVSLLATGLSNRWLADDAQRVAVSSRQWWPSPSGRSAARCSTRWPAGCRSPECGAGCHARAPTPPAAR